MWSQGITSIANPTLTGGFSWVNDTWYHVVGVRDVGGRGGVIYIDGIERFSDAGESTPDTSTEDFVFGSGQGAFGYLVGKIAKVSLWERALSHNEIRQLYVDPLAPFRRRLRFPAPAVAVAVDVDHVSATAIQPLGLVTLPPTVSDY